MAASAELEISPARPADVPGIVDLQEKNLRKNGGTLSVPFASDWFLAAIADMPIIVARRAGEVVGYLVSCPFAAQMHSPIIRAMLGAYPGAPGAYNYGPICVDASERGKGVAAAMFAELRRRLPRREGVTFVRRDNAVSLAVHTKLGMREVAAFTVDGIVFVVLAYEG